MPEARGQGPDPDRFEMFARDFLGALGFRLQEGPGRGADRGRDLLVREKVTGAISSAEKLWLVSAKHKAHSGKSVTDADEPDPIGRARKFGAQGFMAFYSTIPSSGLDDTFARVRPEIDVFVWDKGRIEVALASDLRLKDVFQAYFPESYQRLRVRSGKPSRLFPELLPLTCNYCGKDLLGEDGIVAFVQESGPTEELEVVDLYWSCRGVCDKVLSDRLTKEQVTTWESLNDLRIPIVFMRYVIATMNNLYSNQDRFTKKAFEKEKEFLVAMAQTVFRDTTAEQEERIKDLIGIPEWAGGLAVE